VGPPLAERARARGRLPPTHPTSPHQQHQSRTRSFLVRLGSTVVLIGTFAGIIYLGHVPLAIMILGIQVKSVV
jgi:hypothetical protein